MTVITHVSPDQVRDVNANFDMLQSPKSPRLGRSEMNLLRRPSGDRDDVLFGMEGDEKAKDEDNEDEAIVGSKKGQIPGIFKKMKSWKSKSRLSVNS